MADTYTETTTRSWGSRLGSSLKGVILGFVFIAGGIYLLFWNEGRTVKNKRAYNEGAKTVISVPCDKVDAANEGKLVHISGTAVTSDSLSDPDFGLSLNAIALKRSVEMYQWEEEEKSETKKKLGGSEETTTTYTYKKEWSGSLNNSDNFKKPENHQNPSSFPYSGTEIYAQNVAVGAFKLSSNLISMIGGAETINIAKDSFPAIKGARVISNALYIGEGSPSSPKIGDIKVTFTKVVPQIVSIIGKQTGESFTEYTTNNEHSILMLQNGTTTAEAMFTGAIKSNSRMGWILRAVGLIVIFLGFSMIFKPLSTLADVVPFIGSIVGFGTGLVSGILTISIGLVVIAIAWIYYRPVVAIVLLGITALLIGYLFVGRKKKAV